MKTNFLHNCKFCTTRTTKLGRLLKKYVDNKQGQDTHREMRQRTWTFFVVRVQCRRKESSRSLSHLLMSFLFVVISERFYRAASMHGGLSHERNVRPSVCPSVRRSVYQMRELWKKNERNRCRHSYVTWNIIYYGKKYGWWRTTPSVFTWHFGLNWPRWTENADFPSIFGRSSSAIAPGEKISIKT